jgi:hypothetical protein
MSFQAYLDAIEVETGRTPAELLAVAHERCYGPDTRAARRTAAKVEGNGAVVRWLRGGR